jgi:hypothetical protein
MVRIAGAKVCRVSGSKPTPDSAWHDFYARGRSNRRCDLRHRLYPARQRCRYGGTLASRCFRRRKFRCIGRRHGTGFGKGILRDLPAPRFDACGLEVLFLSHDLDLNVRDRLCRLIVERRHVGLLRAERIHVQTTRACALARQRSDRDFGRGRILGTRCEIDAERGKNFAHGICR